MRTDEKIKNLHSLLEYVLETQKHILRDCYHRPTVSPDTLTEIHNLMAAIEEELNNGSV